MIQGVKQQNATIILAEIGPTTVDAFKTVEHLASWVGKSPESYKKRRIKKSSQTARGNTYLKTTLLMIAELTSRSKYHAFSAMYFRLSGWGLKVTP